MPSTTDTATGTDPQEQPTQEAPQAPSGDAMFDDTRPAPPAAEQGTGDPAPTSDTPAAPAPAEGGEPAAETPAAVTAPVEATDPVAEPAPSATSTRVRLGRVECTLHRVPLGTVQELVASFDERIATLQSSPTIADLQTRMRATEGRCAPIFFLEPDQAGGMPTLFAGVEAIAAAMNLSLPTVSVVAIPPGDAGAAQEFLAKRAAGAPASTTDDPLEVIE